MSKEFIVKDVRDYVQVSYYVHEHFDKTDKNLKIVITESNGNGKWGMARLWYAWMKTTADHMASNGCVMPLMIKADGSHYGERPFNKNDAHALFTSQWLGLNDNGDRLSWSKSEGENIADKGQRFIAMMKHENWCIEKGINLQQPRNSEFYELKDQTNE